MLKAIKAGDIEWVAGAASRFSHWLVHEAPGKTWTAENIERPGICRWTVSWICYERLFEWIWRERWFQEGMIAFGLMALELEGRIEILRAGEDGRLFVRCPDGTEMELAAFLDGESLSIRHDPDFADLAWDPVSAMGHLLAEYTDP